MHQRKRISICLVIASVVTVSLAGCVSPPEQSAPNTTFAVTGASKSPGDCLFSSNASKVCHTLEVLIDNRNSTEDFETNIFYWEAVSAGGGVFKTPQRTGPDAIAAGAQSNITLRFDVTDGSNLQTLRYEGLFMSEPITASIPAY